MLNTYLAGKNKAENEDEVSEADRKLHVRIAAEVKAQLEAKGKSTEGVETFTYVSSL